MRIPLDYYRILGVPIQAHREQLEQAYQDRSQQLPRKEYSQNAIAMRKQLLKQAYEVLSAPETRTEYDAQFLGNISAPESPFPMELPLTETEEKENSFLPSSIPWLDLEPEQLSGALLILQELGEYEIVINLGDTYLRQPRNSQDFLTNRADIILTIALANLELSREQWQQQEYEKAALSGQQGLDLLRQEHLFPTIQGEIASDLYKLRPYQILELLALPLNLVQQRSKGMALLQEMLEQRQGIDGKGDDYSGLNLDDFLRFIQQLRLYLTVDEQQQLFAGEAKRPSAVARYLKVYVLIAQGFAEKEPALMTEAQNILEDLGKRQDVYLEKAICSLLLGQTQAASLALEKTQEQETLSFIRQQSQDDSDLLSGLCIYAEKWLQTEVFSHFRDLASQSASLKEYFADKKVQNYLEKFALSNQPEALEWQEENKTLNSETELAISGYSSSSVRTESASRSHPDPVLVHAQNSTGVYGRAESGTTAILNQPQSSSRVNMASMRQYEHSEYTQGNVALDPSYRQPSTRRRRRRKYSQPVTKVETPVDSPSLTPRKKTKKPYKIRPFRLAFVILLGLTSCAFLFKLFNRDYSPLNTLGSTSLAVQLESPPLDIPAADAHVIITGVLTELGATQVIQEWLFGKSQALGVNHRVDKLKFILADPMLSLWQNRAQALRQRKDYYQYEHQVEVRSVNINSSNPNLATVEAKVREIAKYYQNGQLNSSNSYSDNLLVRYELIRQNNQWKIRNSTILSM